MHLVYWEARSFLLHSVLCGSDLYVCCRFRMPRPRVVDGDCKQPFTPILQEAGPKTSLPWRRSRLLGVWFGTAALHAALACAVSSRSSACPRQEAALPDLRLGSPAADRITAFTAAVFSVLACLFLVPLPLSPHVFVWLKYACAPVFFALR